MGCSESARIASLEEDNKKLKNEISNLKANSSGGTSGTKALQKQLKDMQEMIESLEKVLKEKDDEIDHLKSHHHNH